MDRPYYIIFAGINGAGKTTLFRSDLWQHGKISGVFPRVNSDEILVANGGDWRSRKDQIEAGRTAVQLIKKHFGARESLNQETTLAGRSIVKNIESAHASGYCIVMFYIGVEDVDIAQKRIAHRETIGGHGIDPEVVKRRYTSSIENLVSVLGICDEAYLFDNTGHLSMVARFELGELAYVAAGNPSISWHVPVVEKYGYEQISL